MFNRSQFDNALSSGHAVVEVVEDVGAEARDQRFVPLRRTLLKGVMDGPLVALTVEQEFSFGERVGGAESSAVLEALYRFPLPGDAAVQRVEVHFGDVHIVAALESRADAEAAYAEARSEGRQAALATREAPDVFTLRLSGIRSGEPVRIVTRAVMLARAEGTGWSVRLPLTTAPRFVREDEQGTTAANVNPLAICRDPGHRAALQFDVRGAATVTSPTHQLKTSADAEIGGYHVTLAQGEVLPDRDLLLVIPLLQADTNASLQAWAFDEAGDRVGSGETYVLAQVTPPAGAVQSGAREIILLLDHSGSMQGPKWQAADWAVESFLRSLLPGDSFALGIFHSTTRWFASSLRLADAATVQEAVRWLKSADDSGGTNLGVALEQALSIPRHDGLAARHLLVVTDAEVTDGGRVLRLAEDEAQRPYAQRRRLSILCIDSAPNDWLATELAERGGGVSRFLTSAPDAEDITTAMDGFLADFGAPVLLQARLHINRSAAQGLGQSATAGDNGTCSLDVGDLAAGRSRWVALRTPSAGPPLELRLEGEGTAGLPDVAVAPQKASDGAALKALFGARRINVLEMLAASGRPTGEVADQLTRLGYANASVSQMGASVYAENSLAQTREAVEELLLEESLRYGLASSVVGFVATRSEAGNLVTQRVAVANALPAGWSEQHLYAAAPPNLASTSGVAFSMQASFPQVMYQSSVPSMRVLAQSKPATRPSRKASGGEIEVFAGAPSAGETLLFDSTSSAAVAIPASLTLTGLVCHGADSAEGTLLLYVGDMAQPRAVVRLAELKGARVRPLNLRRKRNETVRLVLRAPCDQPRLRIRILWQ